MVILIKRIYRSRSCLIIFIKKKLVGFSKRCILSLSPKWFDTFNKTLALMLNRLYISERHYQCASLVLNASIDTGFIKSPDFDGDGVYENNLGCSWTIIADTTYIVQLFVLEFQLEKDYWCRFDNLKVKLVIT